MTRCLLGLRGQWVRPTLALRMPAKVTNDGNTRGGSKKRDLGIRFSKDDPQSFGMWYNDVVYRGAVLQRSDAVSGMYVMRPAATAMWRAVSRVLQGALDDSGCEEVSFPSLIPQSALEKEKDHVAGFSPEVAWVTQVGNIDKMNSNSTSSEARKEAAESSSGQLKEPLAVRPTSEAAMYPVLARWLRSYRDLPLRVYQFCNIVRWEFSQPTPLIRSREFLWKEGHSVFRTEAEAAKEIDWVVSDVYRNAVYRDVLGVAVVVGRKTQHETFPGAVYSVSLEAFVAEAGKGVQAATGHYLGDNFSRMFGLRYADEDGSEGKYALQTCWGLSTRALGVALMVHSDNKGVVVAPAAARVHVVVIPVGLKGGNTELADELHAYCQRVATALRSVSWRGVSLRVDVDSDSTKTPGYKINQAELQGVPLRCVVGPQEMKAGELKIVPRVPLHPATQAAPTSAPSGKPQDYTVLIQQLLDDPRSNEVARLLSLMQQQLYTNSRARFAAATDAATSWPELKKSVASRRCSLGGWCGDTECELEVKAHSSFVANDTQPDGSVVEVNHAGAKILCCPDRSMADADSPISDGMRALLPLVDNRSLRCVAPDCGKEARTVALFGHCY